jgi:hypothetical protein
MIYNYPTVIIDNFFKDPLQVRDFALTFNYQPSPIGIFSGVRTDSLHDTHVNFFRSVCEKILNSLSLQYIDYKANLNFHLTGEEFGDNGWVHSDGNGISGQGAILAAIVYLNPQCRDITGGTSLFKLKNLNHTNTSVREMRKSFIDSVDNNELKELNNQNYNETVKVGGVFNRLVMYDAKQDHAGAGYFGDTLETSRLTMLVFFHEIITKNNNSPLRRAEALSNI